MNNWQLQNTNFPSSLSGSLILASFDISTLNANVVSNLFSNIDDSKNNFYIFPISDLRSLTKMKSIIESRKNIAVNFTIRNNLDIVGIKQLKTINCKKILVVAPTEEIVIYANNNDFVGIDHVSIGIGYNVDFVKRLIFICEKNKIEISIFDPITKNLKFPSFIQKYLQ